MKKMMVMIAVCAAVAACGGKKKTTGVESWGGDSVTVLNGRDSITMMFPVAEGGAVADSINGEITKVLESGFVGEENDYRGFTLAQAIDSLLADKNADSITAGIPYRMISEGGHYEKDGIYSVYLQAYYFTGGAHGMTMGRFLNFDAKTGKRLTAADMFMDMDILGGVNREYFAKYLSGGKAEDYEPYLFIEPARVPLPQNIGLDKDGVVMLYNQYEIAAYVFGQTRYVIPYPVVDNILKKY